jgi:polysaccharide export outer membrane protein
MKTYLLASLAALALATTMYGQILVCHPVSPPKGPTEMVCQGCGVRSPVMDNSSTYVIWPGDALHVKVAHPGGTERPNLTRFLTVRLDGKISLPLLNDVQAAGLTPDQVATVIQKQLSIYFAEPEVAVSIVSIRPYPFPSSLRKILNHVD